MFKNEKGQKFVEMCGATVYIVIKIFKLMFQSKVIKYFSIKPTQRESVIGTRKDGFQFLFEELI